MTRFAVRTPAGPGPVLFGRPEPTGAVGSPCPTKPPHDGVRPPLADQRPCSPNLSRAELRRIVIDILG